MIKELQLRILPKTAAESSLLRSYIADEFAIRRDSIKGVRILKRSIDARQRQVFVNLKVRVYINEEPADDEFISIDYKPVSGNKQAIVVGAGPAGLFAALRLIEHDIKPIVIERGKNVRDRKKDIANISREGYVDPESNYSFGEGGAGAYSDGKLYTRSKKRGSVDRILNIFCQHGASTAILADAHPHIGTDRLPRVIENMRNQIIRCGGEVHFQTKMLSLISEGQVRGIIAQDLTTGEEKEFLGPVILATGHSARDVYRYLHSANIFIEPKSLAVGVRLEHPSHIIDQIQYHSRDGRGKYLPAAEYSFVTQVEGRGVYSFCMCPGGFVVPAASGPEQLVVNGMSPSSRGGKWSNSGMVVEVTPESVASSLPSREGQDGFALIMLEYQEKLERLCYNNKGEKLAAPSQRMADFVNNRISADLPATSYSPGIISSPLHFWMPKDIRTRLQQGFKEFGRKSHGFLTNEAILIAMETRTSAPVRIVRDNETLQHIEVSGLYPAGEGAGYAGGIVSAAIDGERCADALAEQNGQS
ncbi:MAG: FAD-binding protein [Bacteroidaceae bacterium]|nr:FAD-binding protein [Bacteroidaceae bacterium]